MSGDAAGRPFALEIGIGTVRGLRFGAEGGRRVLALHGWLDNAASFVPLAARLHGIDGIDLVAPDLPGHGRSAHMPPGTDYTFVGAVHQVLDIADALGWERFALLGHSMGAGIASLVAAAVPERVERLVAIEALGALPEAEPDTVPRLRDAVAAARSLGQRPLRVFPDLEAPIRARMRVNALREPVARLLVERGVQPVDGGHVWCSDPRLTIPTAVRMTPGQVDALIAGIDCPTRVIYADPPQPYLPEPDRSRRARLLPHGDLVVLTGGHHLHMEQPAEVAAAIGSFLQS
ncbi:MAG: alpha/beta hydrolase [Luteimonas sp.]